MSFQITEAFVTSFREGMTLHSQQDMSRLRGRVRVESSIKGTEESYDWVGKRRPTKRTSRHGDTKLSDTPHDRRWVVMDVYDDADLIDKPDMVRTLTDPTNSYTRTMAAGFGRLIDEVIMDAADASAKTGVKGAGAAASLDAAHTIAVGTSGLDLAKITEASRKLNSAEMDDDRHWAITARQLEDLLGITEIVNSDFNTVKALTSGRVDNFMGFNFVRVEDPILKLDGSSDRKTVCWTREGLLIGFGSDVSASIDRRPDKNNSWQVMYSADFGAVRMEDTALLVVMCDEP